MEKSSLGGLGSSYGVSGGGGGAHRKGACCISEHTDYKSIKKEQADRRERGHLDLALRGELAFVFPARVRQRAPSFWSGCSMDAATLRLLFL